MRTYDEDTINGTGAFLVGELERLDPTLNEPLVDYTWGRDIDLRTDVTIANDTTSFTRTGFAASGANSNGKNWVSGNSTEIPGISVKTDKVDSPMFIWGMELGYSIIELARSMEAKRPLERDKFTGLQMKHNMDVDEMVYIGDAHMGKTGLINNPNIAPENVTTNWNTATPKEKLDDINNLIHRAWEQSGFAVCPTDIRLSPLSFSKLLEPVSAAGSKSILQYIKEECLAQAINGREPNILPLKWLRGRGAGGVNRALAYTKAERFVRFPMVPLQRTPLEHRGIHHLATYYGALGVVEFVYPETVAYVDGM